MDLAISYPEVGDTISSTLLVVLSLVVPAVLIIVYTILLIPWPSSRSVLSRNDFWIRKIWELNTGLMGLGFSYATAFFITQGIKILIGKPRPDLLARCVPDLTNVAAHVVGGYGQDISPRWTLVSSSICTQKDTSLLDDGFRSFLSGHSSQSWAGLLYLSFWLSSKAQFTIPYIRPHSTAEKANKRPSSEAEELLPVNNLQSSSGAHMLKRAAGPPLYGAVLFLVPICLAFYICSTRYINMKHQGVDIFSGSVLGVMTAWVGFRLYHGSLSRGEGWAWGPRSADHAFATSNSSHEYLAASSSSGTKRPRKLRDDVEMGNLGVPRMQAAY